jgi:hypothetical protein
MKSIWEGVDFPTFTPEDLKNIEFVDYYYSYGEEGWITKIGITEDRHIYILECRKLGDDE